MRVTQKDIAKRVGVSPQAVAHALNGIGRLRPETRERILKAAQEMGYRTNPMARALVTGKTNLISLWMQRNLSPTYAFMAYTIGQLVADSPYDLIIANVAAHSQMKPGESLQPCSTVALWPTDGILSIGNSDLVEAIVGKHQAPVPVVCIGSTHECQTRIFDVVKTDLYAAAVEAVGHLARTRRRVAFVAAWTLLEAHQPRYRAYRAVMEAAGRPLEIIEVPREADMREITKQTIKDYVAAHGAPDALFCGSDNYSSGALRGLHEIGLRVPHDVAIIGCDGLLETSFTVPSLSTIEQPLEEACRLAGEFLQRRIAEPSLPRQEAVLHAKFIRRESSP
jgi:DNA-binding LacI/PurR family transcriptional regulator